MPGIRVMSPNPSHANKTILIDDPTRLLGHNGLPKRYTIALDDQASALVSEGVWTELQRIIALCPAMPRLMVVGEVAAPPTIHVNDGQRSVRSTLLWTPQGETDLGAQPTP